MIMKQRENLIYILTAPMAIKLGMAVTLCGESHPPSHVTCWSRSYVTDENLKSDLNDIDGHQTFQAVDLKKLGLTSYTDSLLTSASCNIVMNGLLRTAVFFKIQ